MRYCSPALATLIAVLMSVALMLPLAWQRPVHAGTCADSPAANLAGGLYIAGDSTAALPFAEDALRRAEQKCAAKSNALITPLADLASIHQNLGSYDAAALLLMRVIEIKQAAFLSEKTDKLGAALPNMIIDLNNLAFVYGAQGKFEAAGVLFERVLFIAEKAVGDTHMLISQALHNLASNYRARGMHDMAYPLFARAEEIDNSTGDEIPANWSETLGLTPDETLGMHSEKPTSWATSLGLLSEQPL
ncbi:MAG: hypothetical protein CFH38_01124 [Alphaproteobacteria bacterium MarineAlpha10_Bin1]|nr:MAG: hypothetical protein CFH38_01124 [Alphaproteobacteria bacterium MarineAlpha10_Bin1]